MHQFLWNFWREETGQDLIEYSLLITFIAIACAAIISSGQPAVNGIWRTGNNIITQANDIAGG